MSVEVHTSPTALPLGTPQWGEPMKSPPPPVFSEGESSAPAHLDQRRSSWSRKRRFANNRPGFQSKKRRHSSRSQMILPSKFLLGGNISDPLNLNGLSESDEVTPVSSPLPTNNRDNVNIIIPPNITDPLNLIESDDDANDELFYNLAHKKKKHRRRSTKEKDVKELTTPLNIDVETAGRKVADKASPAIPKDKIVSPVIPQTRAWKRRRANSEGPAVALQQHPSQQQAQQIQQPHQQNLDKPLEQLEQQQQQDEKEELEQVEASTSEIKPVSSQEEESSLHPQPTPTVPKVEPTKPTTKPTTPKTKRQNAHTKPKKKEKKETKFIHGNYNRYYGYRNPNLAEDARLGYLDPAWFNGKDVLDVGCNTGHVTLTVARDFLPQRIVGVDIDGYLISVARKNIRHYLLADQKGSEQYPVSMAQCYGPLGRESVTSSAFPGNVYFRQGDFVLESDNLLDLQTPEYDVIMALSITKWMHLNHGDAGLKRTFKRFFRMLRPGGKLILEPQGWASYGKRKKLTDAIYKNYQSIRFRPEHFRDFLVSRHVGFSSCQQLDIPFNKAKGFRRPIYVFTKPAERPVCEPTVTFDLPRRLPPSRTPARLDQTPNSVDSAKFSTGGTFSAPGTPFSAPGTPGTTSGAGTPYWAPSPCSIQSCSECKRRIENGFTPASESPASMDYCSLCSVGSMTPGKYSGGATPQTPGQTSGGRTPDGAHTPFSDPPPTPTEMTSQIIINGHVTSYDTVDNSGLVNGHVGEVTSQETSSDPMTSSEPMTSSDPTTSSEPMTSSQLTISRENTSDSTSADNTTTTVISYEPHTPKEPAPTD